MDNFALLALVVLSGMYFTALGMRQSHLSGFAFYRIGGLVIGILFLLFCLVVSCLQARWREVWLITSLLSIMVRSWQRSQEDKARETHPAEWEAWQTIRRLAGTLDLLLLYPRGNRAKRDE